MDLKNAATVPVFISYSHSDEKYRKALETHLALLQRTGVIEAWHDRMIGPGKEWEHEIESHIELAKIILLLLSPDFLASDYCWSDEGKRALALHEAGQARVIPVILRPCDWKNTPWGKLQALPKAGRPITKWGRRDEAYLDIIEGIRLAVSEFFPSIIQKSLKIDSELTFHQEKNLSTCSREEIELLPSIDTIGKFDKACDIAESRRQKAKNISNAIIILILLILSLVFGLRLFHEMNLQDQPKKPKHDSSKELNKPSSGPILRIETGMHTAPIPSLDVDANDRYLVTGSRDKTVRVWDLTNGRLVRVLRLPIGEESRGSIEAVAITSNGDLIAAGGSTGFAQIKSQNIYIFERQTGRLLRRISGLPSSVLHLTFSPDDTFLAATLFGANGLRVFRTADGIEQFRDIEPKADSYRADFDAAGRLVTSSFDGKIRLYNSDFQKIATRDIPKNKRPFGVAFSPDDQQIAVGYEDSDIVDVFSAHDLHLLFSTNTSGAGKALPQVAWSADQSYLFAAGRFSVQCINFIQRWSQSGRGSPHDLPVSKSTVMGLRALRDGRIIFISSDPPWGVLAPSGDFSLMSARIQADFRGLRDGFRVDNLGEYVRFTYELKGDRPAVFSIRERQLVLDPSSSNSFNGKPLNSPRTSAPDLQITAWENQNIPFINGAPLSLGNNNPSRSLAITADGQSFIIGTECCLYAFRADGTPLWPKPQLTIGGSWAVNLTRDDQLAVAAIGDGTIRWFRVSDGTELLAFFPHRDGKRWVLWTPSGYYDASVGGEDLIGWHVNRGPDQAADFYSSWHFRETFHRPDVIDLVLETLDEAEALRRLDIHSPSAAQPYEALLPPIVTIVGPADGSEISTPTVRLRLNIRSPSGKAIDYLFINVDGRILELRDTGWQEAIAKTASHEFNEEREIQIPRRNCTIEVIAEVAGRRSEPARLQLRWVAPATKREYHAKILAIGVSLYQNSLYDLQLPAKDAVDFANAWKALEDRAFTTVETRVLTDAEATRNAILEGIDWLAETTEGGDDDILIIYLAGYGINDADQYHFLPHDADPARRAHTFISQSYLRDILRGMPARVILFLDLGRPGSSRSIANENEVRKLLDSTSCVNDIAYSTGALVFSATATRQLARENPSLGNSAFTKAFVEALHIANQRRQQLTSTQLESHLYEAVRTMTNQAQTPTVAKAGLPDLVLVPGAVFKATPLSRYPEPCPGGEPP